MPSATQPFRVAIIGGGIGGLCTALSIHKHCGSSVSLDVYEQAPQYKEIGAGVGIGANAVKILHKIGVGEEAAKIAGYRNGYWIQFRKFDNGSEVADVPAAETGYQNYPVHRAEFLDVLKSAVQERGVAELHTDKKCRKLTEQGDEVKIEFEDGTSVTANLVIGCDGIHSASRAQFATDQPEYSGQIAYRGLVPIPAIKDWWKFDSYSVTWLGKDRHFLCFPVSRNETLNIVAFVATSEESLGNLKESWTSTGKKEDVVKAFSGFEDRVQKVIQLMEDNPSKWLINDRKPLDQWVYMGGKVALLGDAAHAMTPHQGSGAGQAIEDGYTLGRALNDYLQSFSSGSKNSLESWMQVYQDVRLPRAQKVQRTSRDAVEIYQARADGMDKLPFDQCVPIIHRRVIDRMKWVWTDDIDAEYDEAVKGQTSANGDKQSPTADSLLPPS